MASSVASFLRSPVQVLCRHASTSTGASRLSDKKLRALVSLYHQAESFVTPENLSDKIDEAFIHRASTMDMNSMLDYKKLRGNSRKDEQQPELWEWEKDAPHARGIDESGWATRSKNRESQVMEALYGIDTSDVHRRRLPGLDVLRDADTVSSDPDEGK